MRCSTPKAVHSSTVILGISVNGVEYATSGAVKFHYIGLPSFTSIVPSSGSFSGGSIVNVNGVNFAHGVNGTAARCRFGLVKEVPAVVVSATLLRCQAPRWEERYFSSIDIAVSFNGVDFIRDVALLAFEYTEEPAVTALFPSSGPIDGMTSIQVLGKSFRNTTTLVCRFGSNATGVPAVFVSATKVLCTSPTVGSPRRFEVEISNNGVDFTSDEMVYEAYTRVAIASLSPNCTSFAGGIEVLVHGQNFLHRGYVFAKEGYARKISSPLSSKYSHPNQLHSGSVFCHFGAAATPVKARYVDTGIIACRAPTLTAAVPESVQKRQIVEFKVSNNGHSFSEASAALPFTYQQAVSVTLVGPSSSAPTVGGTAITLSGNGFDNTSSLACYFGDERVGATFLSASQIMCVAPAVAQAGSVPLHVSNNGVERALAGTFEFFEHPLLSGVSPSFGKASSVVTVLGSGFTNTSSLACRFNDNATVQATFVNATAIKCKAPAASEGWGEDKGAHVVHQVKVTLNGIDFCTSAVPFLVHSISSEASTVQPRSGSVKGGTLVTVQGSGFPQTKELRCRFGSGEVEPAATWLSSTAVQCVAPSGLGVGAVAVVILANGIELSSQPQLSFVYTREAKIYSFAPTTGCACGGSHLHVYGTGFGAGAGNGVVSCSRYLCQTTGGCSSNHTPPFSALSVWEPSRLRDLRQRHARDVPDPRGRYRSIARGAFV